MSSELQFKICVYDLVLATRGRKLELGRSLAALLLCCYAPSDNAFVSCLLRALLNSGFCLRWGLCCRTAVFVEGAGVSSLLPVSMEG